MKKFILLLLFPVMALAELPYAPRISWEPPAQWTSGEPLDPTEIDEYRFYCPGSIERQAIVAIDAPYEWTIPIGVLPPGSNTCHLTAVVIRETSPGVFTEYESDPSESVTFEVLPDRPGPVIIFTVN